jgi:hypothetical protein
MTEQTENLVLEHLRTIRADIADIKNRVTGVEVAITALGQQIAGLTTAVYAGNDRVRDLERRVERIERRLELRETD